jgi:hypothetical protein
LRISAQVGRSRACALLLPSEPFPGAPAG